MSRDFFASLRKRRREMALRAVLTAVLASGLPPLVVRAEPPAATPAVEGELPAPHLGQNPASGGKNSKDSAGKISKFEARHVRHVCHEKADEKGLKGAERETFMQHCFFGRRNTRAERRECRKKGLAQGLERTALQEFVRECAKDAHPHAKTQDSKAPE